MWFCEGRKGVPRHRSGGWVGPCEGAFLPLARPLRLAGRQGTSRTWSAGAPQVCPSPAALWLGRAVTASTAFHPILPVVPSGDDGENGSPEKAIDPAPSLSFPQPEVVRVERQKYDGDLVRAPYPRSRRCRVIGRPRNHEAIHDVPLRDSPAHPCPCVGHSALADTRPRRRSTRRCVASVVRRLGIPSRDARTRHKPRPVWVVSEVPRR